MPPSNPDSSDRPTKAGQKQMSGFDRPTESDSIPGPTGGSADTPGGAFARIVRQSAPFLALAWIVSGALLLGTLGGYWIDSKLGTEPWFLLGGTLLGLLVGMYELARVTMSRRDDSG